MKKIINPVSVLENGKRVNVYCSIEFENDRLSISGVIGPMSNGDCVGSCGQIDMSFRPPENDYNSEFFEFQMKYYNEFMDSIIYKEGWNKADFEKFLTIWKLYHLNHLSPACEHQILLGWDKEKIDPNKSTRAYGKHFDGQKQDSWNLKGWVYPPHGYLTKPCPICGYKYGSAWLKHDVPKDIIEWLFSRPTTKTTPAWV